MPIYEEKLICPLAIRFSQEHIRPTFQDGHEIETTIMEIKVRPGVGDYDCILEAPFPNVEIVRWYPQGHRGSELEDIKHWYTLDNRRLYCLQRVAASLWPKRVAAVAEGLYAVPDGIWRKDDSSTAGFAVAIGHSPKAVIDHWEWRNTVTNPEDSTALSIVVADDAKARVADLADAPAPPSMLDLFFQQGEACTETATPAPPKAQVPKVGPVAESTNSGGSSPRSSSSRDQSGAGAAASAAQAAAPAPAAAATEAASVGFPALRRALVGRWKGEQDEVYEVKFKGGGTWTVTRTDVDGSSKRFTLGWDEDTSAVWWGVNWALYLDPEAVFQGQLRWLPGDGRSTRPRFTWHRAACDPSSQPPKPIRNPTARVKAARVAMERRAARAETQTSA